MTSLSTRGLLTASLLAAWLAGCGRHTSEGAAKPSSPASTPADRSSVTAEDIARNPSQPIEELLATRVPGLTVNRAPDGRLVLRIRGVTSLEASTEPLLVVDGIPVQPGTNDRLAGLNADDIASIEVLKDAAATVMYGARGANGVILIKTKRPER